MLFSRDHIWIDISSNVAKLGISDYAQSELGSIIFLNLPAIGEEIQSGIRFGDIETLKTISDLIAPICGKVIAVNEFLVDNPESIHKKPYECWFIQVEIKHNLNELMDEPTYEEYVKTI